MAACSLVCWTEDITAEGLTEPQLNILTKCFAFMTLTVGSRWCQELSEMLSFFLKVILSIFN